MSKEPSRYHAYLLRLWQVRDSGHVIWRASLENAQTNERVGFSTLDALCDYLQRMAPAPDEDGGEPDEDAAIG
jgi:hypothetical protein